VAIAELEQRGDLRGLAKAHFVASQPHWMACQATATAREVRIAAEYARTAGDEGMRAEALGWYTAALWWGPATASEIAREIEAIEHERPGPYLSSWLEQGRALLASFEGRLEEARQLMQRANEQHLALGLKVRWGALMQDLGRMELRAGDPARAQAALLAADAVLAEAGERSFRSTVQALLAEVHQALGNRNAALAAIELTESLGAEQDLGNLISTCAVRARLALDDGDHAEAERWARSALEHAAKTDFVLEQAEVRFDLARVLAASGNREAAIASAREALSLFENKGNQLGAARVGAAMERL
jgi:tetratricopeptide (TPR) repeat protein